MPAPKRKPVTKTPAAQPAPQEEAKSLKPMQDIKPPEMPVGVYEVPIDTPPENLTVEWVREHGTFHPLPEPEPAPEHVRTLARTIRRHLGNPRISFDAAPNVPVMFGYQCLYHVVNGHPARPIATRDELSEMTDQQMYDKVMAGRQAPRQGFPAGGRG